MSAPPGHRAWIERTESGRRFVAKCECGYVSATRAIERTALSAAVHHVTGVIAQLKRAEIEGRRVERASARLSQGRSTVGPDQRPTKSGPEVLGI